MRRTILILLFVVLVLMLPGCSKISNTWPRVSIEPTGYRFDQTYLPLRNGYVFAENFFEIVDTDAGYDIIIHAVKEDKKHD